MAWNGRSLNASLLAALLGMLAQMTASAAPTAEAPWRFDAAIVDAGNAGDCKMAGDIDGDGFADLVLGGNPDEKLIWYQWPTWRRTEIAVPAVEFTTDSGLADLDGDGDFDIVVPDGEGPDNLVWFENPRPGGDPLDGPAWRRHVIGTVGGWGKDVKPGDFDLDGRKDVAVRSPSQVIVFFGDGDRSWTRVRVPAIDMAEEGMASGDIDGDGDTDLVIHGAWLENPGGASRDPTAWREHSIGDAPTAFKAAVADVDGDGRTDVVFSSSEHRADIRWWSYGAEGPAGPWTGHTVIEQVDRAHTLQAADIDGDGDMDLVIGQLPTVPDPHLFVMENASSDGSKWVRREIDAAPLHDGIVIDLDNDGDLDIYGSGFTGHPPVRVWINRSAPLKGPIPYDRWTYKSVARKGQRTFGLGFADLDRDGRADIVAGRVAYLNPGGDLLGDWRELDLPAKLHGMMALAAGDGEPPTVIAQKSSDGLEIHAAQWSGPEGGWRTAKIGSVPAASHEIGAQGYRIGQIEGGGPPEVAVSSGGGIYYFAQTSADPMGPWRRVHVAREPSDEGFALADIDGDGLADVVATTGEDRRVLWFRNPGDGSETWSPHLIGDVAEAVFPDRLEVADLDGDGRMDVVVTEENGAPDGASTWFWLHPNDLTGDPPWPRRLLAVQGSTNSLDVADVDLDGRVDILTAEHTGLLRLVLWRNLGDARFEPHEIDRGQENHLGARLQDIDLDGDLEIVGIAYDAAGAVQVWRNDGILIPGRDQHFETPKPSVIGSLLDRAARLIHRFVP